MFVTTPCCLVQCSKPSVVNITVLDPTVHLPICFLEYILVVTNQFVQEGRVLSHLNIVTLGLLLLCQSFKFFKIILFYLEFQQKIAKITFILCFY